MLRITEMDRQGGSRMLKVEGRIDGRQLEELARAVTAALEAAPVALEMSGVTYVDRSGVELLHVLRDRGVELRNCSAFVETLVSTDKP